MLKTKIKSSLNETYVKINNFLTKKSSYKNKTIFTMNHFTPRWPFKSTWFFTIPKTNKFQYFIIKSGHYIL